LSTPFQNRLVGSIIVAAAVIIFLPDLLDGEKETYQADFEAIPQAPEFKSKQRSYIHNFPEQKLEKINWTPEVDETAIDQQYASITINDKPETAQFLPSSTVEDDAKAQVNFSPKPLSKKKKQPESSNTTTSLPEKSVLGNAWVIHLGSFKHKKNVNELLKKLKSNGYTAFTTPIKTKNGTLTKVIVGPELIKSELMKKIAPLKKLTLVQGKIAKYKPTK